MPLSANARRWWRAGKLGAHQAAAGAARRTNSPPMASGSQMSKRVSVYARVFAAENRANVESQADRLVV